MGVSNLIRAINKIRKMHSKIEDFVIVQEVPEFGEIVIMSKGVKTRLNGGE
ncbi:MAG: hypothetical protein ABIM30_06240 [candidate division WOR-3 bacterium]